MYIINEIVSNFFYLHSSFSSFIQCAISTQSVHRSVWMSKTIISASSLFSGWGLGLYGCLEWGFVLCAESLEVSCVWGEESFGSSGGAKGASTCYSVTVWGNPTCCGSSVLHVPFLSQQAADVLHVLCYQLLCTYLSPACSRGLRCLVHIVKYVASEKLYSKCIKTPSICLKLHSQKMLTFSVKSTESSGDAHLRN